MKRLMVIAISAVVALVALIGSASASAATEFGDACPGTQIAPGQFTLVSLTPTSTAIPISAPVGGVITQITELAASPSFPLPIPIPEQVKVLHPGAGPNTYTVTAETNIEVHNETVNVIPVRLPVQAGERLGLVGLPFSYEGSAIPGLSFYCSGPGVTGVLGATMGNVGQGQTGFFEPVVEGSVPLVAKIEPDADGDGYGDETQDKCPTSAATHEACPAPAAPITLSASTATKKKSVTVTLTSTGPATVTVGGFANLGNGKKAGLVGVTQAVTPGTLAKFTVLFPGSFQQKLKQTPKSKKLTLSISAAAPGATSTALTVKVKGQMKPQKKHKKS